MIEKVEQYINENKESLRFILSTVGYRMPCQAGWNVKFWAWALLRKYLSYALRRGVESSVQNNLKNFPHEHVLLHKDSFIKHVLLHKDSFEKDVLLHKDSFEKHVLLHKDH